MLMLPKIQTHQDLDINLDSDSNAVFSTNTIASIVYEESSTANPSEFESENGPSVNHHFINDSEFASSFISQVDAEIKFGLILNLKTPRLSRNSEDVIIVHNKKKASKMRE